MSRFKYTVVVPVYNRADEVEELLASLAAQECRDFDMVIVEDGSTEPCKDIVDQYLDRIQIQYFFKENSGPGDSRNFGIQRAEGEYVVLFDSDCVIPAHYFCRVNEFLATNDLDCFGGPDSAHESFSDIQKAINYSMTSFITTGGIRGKKKQVDTFQPRSFNMGIRREVIESVGGFSDIHPGEDPDLSYRIMNAGYTTGLIPNANVYHKRRIDFKKFWKQVYKFGVVRVILGKWHPGTMKWVYFFPSLFLVGCICLVIAALLVHPLFLSPILLFILMIALEAGIQTKKLNIAFYAVYASFVQMFGYGWGFLQSFWRVKIFKIEERIAFKHFFFNVGARGIKS